MAAKLCVNVAKPGPQNMKSSIFTHRARLVFLLLMIGLASLAVRVLIGYRFHESALLYVGIPFLIALALIVAGILVVHLKPRKEAPIYPIRKDI